MKKLTTTFAIALLATATFFNANAEDNKSTSKPTANTTTLLDYKYSNLKVGMYEVGEVNSLKLNFALTKDAGKTATVKLMNEKGNVLSTETVGKKETGYNFRFDFSETPTGKYYIEVTNGESIITKEIIKGTSSLSY